MKTLRAVTGILGLGLLLAGVIASLAQGGAPQPPLPAESTTSTPQQSPAAIDAAAAQFAVALPTLEESPRTGSAPNPHRRPQFLSPWAHEIVKLVHAGIQEDVILTFIDSSGTFNLGADQIIRLQGEGVSSDLLSAMLQHDQELASGVRMLTTSTSPPLDPEMERILAAVLSPPRKSTPPTATKPLPQRATEEQPAEALWCEFSEPAPPVNENAKAVNVLPVKNDAAELFQTTTAAQNVSAANKRLGNFRVPETQPVEFMPPILVLRSMGPRPNVIIVEMFPSSR